MRLKMSVAQANRRQANAVHGDAVANNDVVHTQPIATDVELYILAHRRDVFDLTNGLNDACKHGVILADKAMEVFL